MIEEHDYAFKVVIVGNQGVGKSSLFLRFCDRNFVENYLPTIGVDFRFKRHEVDNFICKLQIWDTAGQERFRTITSAYYRSSQAILIVFDLTDPLSFTEIENYWLQEAKNNSDSNGLICVIGNKADMENNVDNNHVEKFCSHAGINFYKISAKTGEGIEEMFTDLCLQLIKQSKIRPAIKSKSKSKGKKLEEDEKRETKKCCGN